MSTITRPRPAAPSSPEGQPLPVQPVQEKEPFYKTLLFKAGVGATALITAVTVGVGIGRSSDKGEGTHDGPVATATAFPGESETPSATTSESVVPSEATTPEESKQEKLDAQAEKDAKTAKSALDAELDDFWGMTKQTQLKAVAQKMLDVENGAYAANFATPLVLNGQEQQSIIESSPLRIGALYNTRQQILDQEAYLSTLIFCQGEDPTADQSDLDKDMARKMLSGKFYDPTDMVANRDKKNIANNTTSLSKITALEARGGTDLHTITYEGKKIQVVTIKAHDPGGDDVTIDFTPVEVQFTGSNLSDPDGNTENQTYTIVLWQKLKSTET